MSEIASYLASRGHALRRQGGVLVTTCPVHLESHPSFTIWLDRDRAHCFGCGAHFNDVVALIAALECPGLAGSERWREAYRLARARGFEPEGRRAYAPPSRRETGPNAEQRAALGVALAHYRRELAASADAQRYFQWRGVHDLSAVSVGYCSGEPASFQRLCGELAERLGERRWREVATSVGLLHADSGAERLRWRVFLAEVRSGEVVYYQARALGSRARVRYLSPPSLSRALFGWESLRGKGPVALVEGPFDALPLIAVGQPAVAALGTEVTHLAEVILAAESRSVAVAFDRDEPGEKAAGPLLEKLDRAAVAAFRFRPKAPYKDPGEWAAAEGAGAVAEAITATAELALFRPGL